MGDLCPVERINHFQMQRRKHEGTKISECSAESTLNHNAHKVTRYAGNSLCSGKGGSHNTGHWRQGFRGPGDAAVTVTFTTALCESCPSLAVAISVYMPGAVKRPLVVAVPFVTGIGPAGSNVAFAGPPY